MSRGEFNEGGEHVQRIKSEVVPKLCVRCTATGFVFLGIAGGVGELPHGKGSKVVRRGVSCEMCEDTFWTGTR